MSDVNAYAVCDGYVQIQEVMGNSSLVNIILKPINHGNITGVNIEYFIYRGIRKVSLLNSSNPAEIAPCGEAAIKLVNDIWNNQDKMNAIYGDEGNPSAKILLKDMLAGGYVDDLFVADTGFCAPKVKAGESIGVFDGMHIGFEIMLGHYGLSVKAAEVWRTVSIYDSENEVITSPIEEKSFREKILDYIDPAAWYGMLLSGGGFYIRPDSDYLCSNTSQTMVDLFKRMFYNYNVVYIDIRQDVGISKSFYTDEDYGILVNIYTSDGLAVDINVPCHLIAGVWPLYTYKSELGRSGDVISLIMNVTKVYISAEEAEVCAEEAMFYIPINSIYHNGNEYRNPQGTLKFFQPVSCEKDAETPCLSCYDRFIMLSSSFDHDYIVSNYIKMVCCTKNGSTSILPTNHYIDNLFPVIYEDAPDFLLNGKSINKMFGYERYVDSRQNKTSIAENGISPVVSAIYRSGISFGIDRVTFFAVPKICNDANDSYYIDNNISEGVVKEGLFLEYIISNVFPDNRLVKHKIRPMEGGGDVMFLAMKPLLLSELGMEARGSVIAISLTKKEYASLNELIRNSGFALDIHPVLLQMDNSDNIPEDKEDFSEIPQKYKSMNLRLSGLDDNGHVMTASTGITVYSSDGAIYCSALSEDEFTDIPVKIITDYAEGNIEVVLNDNLRNNNKMMDIMSIIQKISLFKSLVAKALHNTSVMKLEINLLDNFDKYENSSSEAHSVSQLRSYSRIEFNYLRVANYTPILIVNTFFHELLHAVFSPIWTLFDQPNNAEVKANYPHEYKCYEKYNKGGIKFMGGQHNLMALKYRPLLIKCMREFDTLISCHDRSGTVAYEDLFDKNSKVIVSQYSTSEYYVACSWAGLFSLTLTSTNATYWWRKYAFGNKYLYLKYLFILINALGRYKNDTSWYDQVRQCYISHGNVNPEIFDEP